MARKHFGGLWLAAMFASLLLLRASVFVDRVAPFWIGIAYVVLLGSFMAYAGWRWWRNRDDA